MVDEKILSDYIYWKRLFDCICGLLKDETKNKALAILGISKLMNCIDKLAFAITNSLLWKSRQLKQNQTTATFATWLTIDSKVSATSQYHAMRYTHCYRFFKWCNKQSFGRVILLLSRSAVHVIVRTSQRFAACHGSEMLCMLWLTLSTMYQVYRMPVRRDLNTLFVINASPP